MLLVPKVSSLLKYLLSESGTEIKKEIEKLRMADKLLLIEDVWDDIAKKNLELPLPEWQRKELDSRLSQYRAGQLKTKNWNEVHQELRDKHK